MTETPARQLVAAEWVGEKRIRVSFDDGASKEVDVADRLWGPVFAEIAASDEAFSRLFYDPEMGTVCWPGDIDLAPELFEILPDVGHR